MLKQQKKLDADQSKNVIGGQKEHQYYCTYSGGSTATISGNDLSSATQSAWIGKQSGETSVTCQLDQWYNKLYY